MKNIFAKSLPAFTAIALCLMVPTLHAQTPAQDAATVDADKQALDDAKSALERDTVQLNADAAAKNDAAVKADTDAMVRDKEAMADATAKLTTDSQQFQKDNAYFNAAPDTVPSAGLQQNAAPPQNTIPGTSITTPAITGVQTQAPPAAAPQQAAP